MGKLIPADTKQCQAEILEGSFMTLGPRSFRRCTNAPTVIVKDRSPGPDGQVGSMSLCASCLAVFTRKYTLSSYTVTSIAVESSTDVQDNDPTDSC